MTAQPSPGAHAMWRAVPADTPARLADALAGAAPGARVLFRDDDVAAPDAGLERLVELFRRFRMPLALAVVPAWLDRDGATGLLGLLGGDADLFCLHQHGWSHENHEPAGKKCEFGPARPAGQKLLDLRRGRDRLADLLGWRFRPVFTPPWNRMDAESLAGLDGLGFRAVSRFAGARPAAPAALADIPMTVDLHTRKEPTPAEAFEAMFAGLADGLRQGRAGVMLHHGRMDDGAFDFLDRLLASIRASGVSPASLL